MSILAIVLAAAVQSSAPTAAVPTDLSAARAAIKACRETPPAADDKACKGEWKGLPFRVYSDFSGGITVPLEGKTEGVEWEYSCSTDRVEDTKTCLMHTGSRSLLFLESDQTLFWGTEPYPGSEKVARVGKNQPVRFKENVGLPAKAHAALLAQMEAAPSAIFRFQTWPDDFSRDIEVDLTQFRDVRTFFRALYAEYRIAK